MTTTKTAQHTPGPWSLQKYTFGYDIRGPHGEDLGSVNVSDGADEPEFYPADANARLIAEAPALLEVLKAALPQVHWANIHGSRNDELVTTIEAAIAKATGGQP